MGVVYEARDRESGQSVALKTLLNATPAALYMFKQEFRTLADVDHPNLVRLYEFVMSDSDRVFFTMELVRGTDFLSYVRGPAAHGEPPPRVAEKSTERSIKGDGNAAPDARRALDPPLHSAGNPTRKRGQADFDRIRSPLIQLIEGVMALHAARKLHRDIKPSNVLVTPEGRVVLLDFGVATELSRAANDEVREENELVGTAAYMAPEQPFEEPTPACDWYSVGVMLYEAIVGNPPFAGSVTDVLETKNRLDARPPSEFVEDVPADLEALCCALLRREPTARPTGPEILQRLGLAAGQRVEITSSGVMPVADAAAGVDLAGREMHLRMLRDAFDTSRKGSMVTVRVRGHSGMGKSALVHCFLDGLVERRDALVLRGRSYAHEAVPYKAVDGVIDALSRYLISVPDDDLSVVLPKDTWAVVRLFPVLRRVPAIQALAEEPVSDPQLVRRRAFRALRELFALLARRRPLVLSIDDAHWGDTDSAALVLELIRPPHAPPLLLTMTCREEEEQASLFLRDLKARCPQHVDMRDLVVGPLEYPEALLLAIRLLGSNDDSARAMADAIARESAGSPFLIEELVRGVASQARILAGATVMVGHGALEQLVRERLAQLPDDARRCLEIVAVSGRPVPVTVASEASDLGEALGGMVALLRARRFARAGIRAGREVIEVLHERIRETIVAQLSAATVREHHDRLARALEGAPDPDVEALAIHLFAAGNTDRAVQFAERAAEQAVVKLAFDQAAHLLRLTLDTFPTSSAEGSRLRKRLGEVLEWAGRGAEAGRVYLEAAEGAPWLQKLDMQRAAAEQFHSAGLMDEGSQVLRSVLAAVGVWAPRSPLTALLWWIWQHLWLRLVGLRFRARELRPDERLRLDTLNAVALGFALVDHILGIAMKARVLVVALREGDRVHASRGAALVALDVAGYVGPERSTERSLRALAQRLVAEEPSPVAKYTVRLASAVTLHYRGRFKEAKEALDPIQALASNRRVGQQTALLFTIHSIQFLGDMSDLTDRYTRALVEAEERGNLFMSVALRTSTAASVWLAADDPAKARRELREAMAQWAQRRFSSPEWRATLSEAEVDLYVGDAPGAYERVKGLLRAMTKNFFLVYYSRALVAFIHGRAAIASLPSLSPGRRRARVRETRRLIGVVGQKRMPWTAPLVSILEAGVARALGDRARAEAGLRAAITGAEAADMALHAAAARHELGLSIGGVEGAALVRDAAEAMATRGVQAPARFAPMLVPGHRCPGTREMVAG
jgi:eukaryotic-like serine/threonine-protein kinase